MILWGFRKLKRRKFNLKLHRNIPNLIIRKLNLPWSRLSRKRIVCIITRKIRRWLFLSWISMMKMIVSQMTLKLQQNKLSRCLPITMFLKKHRVWLKWRISWLESRKRRRRNINPSLLRLMRTNFLIIMFGLTPGSPTGWKINIGDSSRPTGEGDIFAFRHRKVCKNLTTSKSNSSQKNQRRGQNQRKAIFGPEGNVAKRSRRRRNKRSHRQLRKTLSCGTNTTSKIHKNDLTNKMETII